jgi:hypothetical protein
MRTRVAAATIVMGFSGLADEILLLRELLIVFSGNELSIGLIMANWLLLEAAGSYFLGKTAERRKIREGGARASAGAPPPFRLPAGRRPGLKAAPAHRPAKLGYISSRHAALECRV